MNANGPNDAFILSHKHQWLFKLALSFPINQYPKKIVEEN